MGRRRKEASGRGTREARGQGDERGCFAGGGERGFGNKVVGEEHVPGGFLWHITMCWHVCRKVRTSQAVSLSETI